MPIQFRRAVLGATNELTKGTANAPTLAQSGIQIRDLNMVQNLTVIERERLAHSFGHIPALIGNRGVTLTFNVPMRGHVAGGLVPEMAALLKGCGQLEAIVGGTSVTYTPETDHDTVATVTLDVYRPGKRWRSVGCMGTARLVVRENEEPRWEFEFRGVYQEGTDTSFVSPTYPALRPPDPVGATSFSFRSYTVVATGFELDLGNEVELREDIVQASGFRHAMIVDRKPRLTLDPEEDLNSVFNWESSMTAGTIGQFLFQLGSLTGNTHRILAPRAQVVDLPFAERSGKLIRQIALQLNEDVGDDEVTYRIT